MTVEKANSSRIPKTNRMSRVIIFSRMFPSYHPKKGEPTFFVEKIYKSLYLMKAVPKEIVEAFNFEIMNDDAVAPKHHTIRAGNRWKVGDNFSPRVWSGKPYQSKQVTIASDIEIKKIWTFEISVSGYYSLNENYKPYLTAKQIIEIAKNDGLDINDFFAWFEKTKRPFLGQVICWNENINY